MCISFIFYLQIIFNFDIFLYCKKIYGRAGIPVTDAIQSTKCDARAYPDGSPNAHPRADTNDTTPICVQIPPSFNTIGPPESPLHVPCAAKSHPVAQIVDPIMADPNVLEQTAFVITRRLTQLRVCETDPPSAVNPNPETRACSPANEVVCCPERARRIN